MNATVQEEDDDQNVQRLSYRQFELWNDEERWVDLRFSKNEISRIVNALWLLGIGDGIVCEMLFSGGSRRLAFPCDFTDLTDSNICETKKEVLCVTVSLTLSVS